MTARLHASGYPGSAAYPAVIGHYVAVNDPHHTVPDNAPACTLSVAPYNTKSSSTHAATIGTVLEPGIKPDGISNTGTEAYTRGRDTAGASDGSFNKVISATKGFRYDDTGGEVDDRTRMQKLADKLSPGSAVGKHTRCASAALPSYSMLHWKRQTHTQQARAARFFIYALQRSHQQPTCTIFTCFIEHSDAHNNA